VLAIALRGTAERSERRGRRTAAVGFVLIPTVIIGIEGR
jgi:hypothetical protein